MLLFALRVPFFRAPILNPDETIWAVYGEAMRAGLVPYRDFLENKPPGIFTIYALASFFDPWNLTAVRVFAFLAHGIAAFLLTRIGDEIERPWAGYLAALAYVLASSACVPRDFQAAETEPFMAPASIAGFWTMVRFLKSGKLRWACMWGIAGFLATMIKQPGACDFIVVGLGLLMLAGTNRVALPALKRGIVCALAGGLLPLAALLVYLQVRGLLGDFFDAVYFTARENYKVPDNAFLTVLGCWWDLFRINPLTYGAGLAISVLGLLTAPFWMPSLMAAKATPHDGSMPSMATIRWATYFLACCWGVGAQWGAHMGGHPFAHYFIQTLPPCCFALGFAFAGGAVGRDGEQQWANAFRNLAAAAAIVGSNTHGLVEHILPAMRGEVPAFGGEMPRIAEAVAAITEPNDRIGMWGFAPQIYFYARRFPACRDSVGGPMSGWNPYAQKEGAAERVSKTVRAKGLEDYRVNKPKLIVDLSKAGFVDLETFPELHQYVKEHYVVYQKFDVSWWGNDPGQILLWARLADK